MPQMAPMWWVMWMFVFWAVTFTFMVVNYYTGNSITKSSQPSLKSKVEVHKRKFAEILNKLLNE